MGLWDFLGPLNAGGHRRGWDALPAAVPAETRAVDFSRPGPTTLDGARSYWTPMNAPALTTGDAAACSAVEACLGVLASSVAEPPLGTYRPGPSGGADRVPAAVPSLAALLARPNPALTLASMLAHATVSKRTDGNGYWRKIRSGDPVRGNVVELWPVAPTRIEPFTRSGSSEFISAYRYTDEHGRAHELPAENVVHFRYGVDPSDHRLGYAPLRKLTAEVASDIQATRYAARLLQNLAINGLTLSFDKESPPIDQATADELKARISAAYGGDNVGATAVLSPGAQLNALGFSPQQMDLATLHRVPEERIAAVLGVPAAMVGLGVGLEHCIISNVRIATPDRGPVKIQDFEAGDTVWAVQDGRLQAAHVSWAGKTGHLPVFRVKTPNRTLTASENHPFLTRRMEKVPAPMPGARRSAEWRYRLEWVRLRDLVPGDAIVSSARLPDVGRLTLPDDTQATEDWLEWFGAFVGDGSYAGGERDVGLTMAIPKTSRVGDHYRALTMRLFDEHRYLSGGERPWKRADDGRTEQIVARLADGESYHAIGRALGMPAATVRSRHIVATRPPLPAVHGPVHLVETLNAFMFMSVKASRWVRSLGFRRGARLKRIPPWVFGLAEPLRLAFLRGLLDTDGTVDKRGVATVTLASEELVHDLWYLAMSCGIAVSNVRALEMLGSRLPNPGRQDVYQAWTVTLTSADDVRRIGTHDPTYQAYLDTTRRQTRRAVAANHPKSAAILPDGCVFSKIQSITPAGTEDVYDLTVEGAHNFIAQGLAVHNSIYNNVRQAEEHFTERTLIPEWRALAATLTMSLLPDFSSDRALFLDFDTRNVRALQEDQDALAARLVTLVETGILTIDEARASLDKAPLPAAAAPSPAEARRRPYVVRMPGRKAVEDLLGGYDDVRRASLPDWERDLRAFFRAQAARIAGRAEDGERTAFALVPESESVALRATLSPLQLALLDDLVPLVAAELGIEFQLSDPATRDYLRAAGASIGGITDTTRRDVQAALIEGQADGEGIPELARRLRGLPAFDAARAALVARTELGTAQNTAALASYRASGVVVGVRVLDGDADAACAAMNGRVFPLDQPPAMLEHPNCTRALVPLTNADDAAVSA